MTTLVTRFDAIAALLWSPFVAICCFAIACAVAWVARYDRKASRNPFAVRPDVQAERKELHKRAWGEQRAECEEGASCSADDHTYSWPCAYAPGTGSLTGGAA